jgi:hypothetical protein
MAAQLAQVPGVKVTSYAWAADSRPHRARLGGLRKTVALRCLSSSLKRSYGSTKRILGHEGSGQDHGLVLFLAIAGEADVPTTSQSFTIQLTTTGLAFTLVAGAGVFRQMAFLSVRHAGVAH